jgi:glycosyltransferase involved in cell wall biosynthesis
MNPDSTPNHKPHVAILMATYNGERYVAELIESVLKQTWPSWTLYVRDDGSQDRTREIVEHYAAEHPSRLRILPAGGVRLGVEGNFSCLLEAAEGPYFMFCDQDDVWLPEKVEKSMNLMGSLEAESLAGTPLLVYTDLRPVDVNLRELDTSVWRHGKHDPDCGKRLNRLVVQNMVFGCTILMNRALKDLVLPIPEQAVQYDWWFALVAACLGRTDYVPEATLLYRLHGSNTVGALPWGPRYIWSKALLFFDRTALSEVLLRSQLQAGALLDRFGDSMSQDQHEMLAAYATLRDRGFLARRSVLIKYRILKTGWVRNLGLLAGV